MQDPQIYLTGPKADKGLLTTLGLIGAFVAVSALYLAPKVERQTRIELAPAVKYVPKRHDTLEGCARREGLQSRGDIDTFVGSVIERNERYKQIDGVGYRRIVGDGPSGSDRAEEGTIYESVEIEMPDVNRNGKACE